MAETINSKELFGDNTFKTSEVLGEPQKNFGVGIAKDALSRLVAIPETAMTLGSGVLSSLTQPINKYAQLAVGKTEQEATKEAEAMSAATTYQPVTEYGKQTANIAGRVLGLPFEIARDVFGKPARQMLEESVVGQGIKAAGGRPELVGQPLEEAITFGLGVKGLQIIPKVIGKGAQALKETLAARRMGIPEVTTEVPPVIPKPTPVEESLKTDTNEVEINKQMNEPGLADMKKAVEVPPAVIPETAPETAPAIPPDETLPVAKVGSSPSEIVQPGANVEGKTIKTSLFGGKFEVTEPPIPEGKIRLYRGEPNKPSTWSEEVGKVVAPEELHGQWFTPNKSYAFYYASDANGEFPSGAKLAYIDVPANTDLAQWYPKGLLGKNEVSGKELIVPTTESRNVKYSEIKPSPETEIARGPLSKKDMAPTGELIPPGEGTETTLALKAEAEAIKTGLIGEEGYGELTKYDKMSMDEQTSHSQQIMDADWPMAVKIAMGDVPPPEGLRVLNVFKSVVQRAKELGDSETIRKLAMESPIGRRGSELGQEIKAADIGIENDPVKTIQDITKIRSDVVERTTGKKPNVTKQSEEISRLSKELEETEAALNEHIARTETRTIETAIDDIIKPSKPEKPQPVEKGYGSKNKIITTSEYEKARDELRVQFGTQLSAGLDPTIAAKMGKIGVYHFEAGLREFGEWSNRVTKDVGEWVKPHLQDIWEQTKNAFRKSVTDFTSGKITKAISETDNPEIGRYVQTLAKEFVSTGIKDRDSLITAVHDVLKEIIPDITRRETMDAISGYGKYKLLSKDEISTQLRDLKGQMQQVAKLEDLQSKQPPLKTGVERRTPSDEERRLIKLVDEAKRKYGIQAVDKETQLKSALDSIKTRLTNQIADLESQIASGQKIIKEKTNIVYDVEAKNLLAKRDELKVIFDKIFGTPKTTEAQRILMAMNSVKKSITEYERRIKEKDLTPSSKRTVLHSEELDKLRADRDVLKKQFQELKDAANPKKTPDQIVLQSLKTRLTNEEQKLTDKLKNLDFTPKEKRTIALDPEAQKLKIARDTAKKNYDVFMKSSIVPTREEVAKIVELSKVTSDAKTIMDQGGKDFNDNYQKYREASMAFDEYVNKLKGDARTPFEKVMAFEVKWRRFLLLSSVKTVGKLTSAAASRFVTSPMEDIAAGFWSHVPGVSRVMEKSPRFAGGLNIGAEAKAFRQFVERQTYRDIRETAKTGKGQLDVLYGEKQRLPPEALDFFGQLHGALKVIPKRTEFFRSLEKRTAWEIKNGTDMTVPLEQIRVSTEALADANRAILMQKNVTTNAYSFFLQYLQRQGKGGQATAAALQNIFPIVRVPTNYVSEVGNYAFGVPKGVVQVMKVLIEKDGLKNLTREQSDNIARSLSKGLVGPAFFMIGYYNDQNVGGYWQPGEKRRASDVSAVGIKIGGTELPHFMLHIPVVEMIHIGATVHRIIRKGGSALAGGFRAGAGLVSQVPFLEEPVRMAEASKSANTAGKFLTELGKSMVIPPDVSNIAQLMDTTSSGKVIQRKAKTPLDVLKLSIPGFRQQVRRR